MAVSNLTQGDSLGEAKPWLLDLFCGAGGATKGYQKAGWKVYGVDIKPQPNYCGDEFLQADALETLEHLLSRGWLPLGKGAAIALHGFRGIHTSPPCQRDTSMQSVAKNADAHPDLIGPTRALLAMTGLPYVIENVEGAYAKMLSPFRLCGSSFGLGVNVWAPIGGMMERRQLRRHRYFETNWPIGFVPGCAHNGRTVGIYGDHLRFGRRSSHGELSGERALSLGSAAMGIDWMTWNELKEALPPAYTAWIGGLLLAHIRREGHIHSGCEKPPASEEGVAA